MTQLRIPERLAETCRSEPGGPAWLDSLADRVRSLETRWSLRVGEPFEAEGSCAWVAPADRSDASAFVLKIGLPHMESLHEIAGLRFWDGDPMVRLIDAAEEQGALLLERCLPGTPLRELSEPQQDPVIADLLLRLWRVPPQGHPFRPLSEMIAHWKRGAEADPSAWPDEGLARQALQLFDELPQQRSAAVLLATDLHAGNVLRAERRGWLAIDPKPFVGDPAYDASQHLLNCPERLQADPRELAASFARRIDQDPERVRLWLFARIALHAARRDPARWLKVARALAP